MTTLPTVWLCHQCVRHGQSDPLNPFKTKMMKKTSLIFLALFFLMGYANGQPDVRTTETKIADILARFPTQNQADFDRIMKEMSQLGTTGLWQLARQMSPVGDADNSKYEYAIMGYTSYVSAPGKEELKKGAEEAWLRAMLETRDKNLTSFFMSMIEIIGADRSVPVLSKYLDDPDLGLKAAPTLAAIHTTAAGKTLLTSLVTRDVPKVAVIQALGDMKYAPALDHLNAFVMSDSKPLRDAALTSLTKIADPISEGILLEQTRANGKDYENREATAMYAAYLHNLIAGGNTKEVQTIVQTFMKNTKNSNVFARTAALNSLVLLQKDAALGELVKASLDKDSEYREATLAMASPFVNKNNISLFSKNLKKALDEVKISLINFLAAHSDKESVGTFIELAQKSKNDAVRQAAILAIGQTGNRDNTPSLLSLLSQHNGDVQTIKKALLLIHDNDLAPKVVSAVAKSDGEQKSVLLDVLAARGSDEGFEVVVSSLNSPEEDVRASALNALPQVSSGQHIQQLFGLLMEAADEAEVQSVQKAIRNSLNELPDKEAIVLKQLENTPDEKQYLLFPALSDLGTPEALHQVYESYKNNTGPRAQQALDALASWPSVNAMDDLFAIATNSRNTEDIHIALKGYVRLIRSVDFTDAQKLLLLKKAMAVTNEPSIKGSIIDQAGAITTFPSLAFVAKYLDGKDVNQKGAMAVMNIALSSPDFHGTLVRYWLTKAMNTISGEDDVYMKKSIQKFLDDMPSQEGYIALFNSKDLAGWKGLVADPIKRSQMTPAQLTEAQKKADSVMRQGWIVENGDLIFTGKGDNIATVRKYGNMEMLVDWKIFNDGQKDGDAGIYLRGTPQVQIWDTSRRDVGAEVGSGGLYNNQKHRSTPLKVADNQLGEWNHFYIRMTNDTVTVYLNGELVTDHIPLENYWDRNMPLWPEEQIELQAHGSRIGYRDIYIRELPDNKPFALSNEEKVEGFQVLFDGKNLDNFQGNLADYMVEDGNMIVKPKEGSHGNLYTKEEYDDFVYRFEFRLTPGANNGVGIRTPTEGDAAYVGMEIQVLDNTADIYKNLESYQYHGSVYGIIPAKRGFLRPLGEWNTEEITARGNRIKVVLNGETIVDGDIKEATKNGTMDGKAHPGLFNKKGHIGFLGHGSVVYFRNIRIKEL